ncbi:MAG: hypothetical protein JXR37_05785 [Kiritimatiellae bacterium]|nr:hypothetical protein [Kiritimatiellia bacterium]
MKHRRWLAVLVAAGWACGGAAPCAARPARWRALFADIPTSTQTVRLVNADFEAGDKLTGWLGNPSAAVDTAERHGGRRSLRLTNPGRDGKFHPQITQQIPVRPLADYTVRAFARTRNLTDPDRKQDPSGARVIIQWVDSDHTWFCVGDNTSRPKPDADWQEIKCTATAPVGAAYATLFISLRANGTAWFDDIEVSEVVRALELREPADGARVRDNTPAFSWSFVPGVDFEVQVSPDPAFPPASVQAQRTEEMALDWDTPLAPGVWYWRVVSPTARVESAPCRFEQTAPADADTAGPRLETWHHWVGPKPLELRYRDPSGIGAVRLTLDGQDVSAAVQWGQETAVYRPPADWPAGLHRARVELADRAGNVTRRDLWLSHSAPMPSVIWRPRGALSIGGRPHFPLGLYQVKPEDMAKVAAGGFTMVHDYQFEGNRVDNAAALDYLTAAGQAGLTVFMGLSREALMSADFAWVADRVAGVMGHPALLAWYLFDEPGHGTQYCPPALLAAHRRLMKALDPFHPAIVTVPGPARTKQLYEPAFDVHWTQVYRSPEQIASALDDDRAALAADKALMGIVNCGIGREYLNAANVRSQGAYESLARDRFRPEAFMALAHESSGLAWWWFGKSGKEKKVSIGDVPAAWAALTGVVTQVRSLEPVLVAEGETRRWTSGPEGASDAVHLWEKRHSGGTLIVAVNRRSQPCRVTFKPSAVPDGGTLDVLGENRKVAVRGGCVEETFEPLGVHVYAARPAR